MCIRESKIERLATIIKTVRFHRKEGNVLFNDVPNTFYLRLYVVR